MHTALLGKIHFIASDVENSYIGLMQVYVQTMCTTVYIINNLLYLAGYGDSQLAIG